MLEDPTSALPTVSKQYADVALHELDFDWVASCTDARKMRHAVRLLEPEATSYPDLHRAALAKLAELDPDRAGRALPGAASSREVAAALDDLFSWTKEIKALDSSLSKDSSASSAAATDKTVSSTSGKHAASQRAKSLGNDSFRCGEYQRALAHYTAALALAPPPRPRAELWANRAAALLRLSLWGRAERDAAAAVRTEPQWPRGWERLAAARAGMKQHRDAVAAYHVALALTNDSLNNPESQSPSQSAAGTNAGATASAAASAIVSATVSATANAAATAADVKRLESKLAAAVAAWDESDSFGTDQYRKELAAGQQGAAAAGGWVPRLPLSAAAVEAFVGTVMPPVVEDEASRGKKDKRGDDDGDDDDDESASAAAAPVKEVKPAVIVKEAKPRKTKPKNSAPVNIGGVTIEEASETESDADNDDNNDDDDDDDEVVVVRRTDSHSNTNTNSANPNTRAAAASAKAAPSASAGAGAGAGAGRKLQVVDDDDDDDDDNEEEEEEEDEFVPITIKK